jgi:diphthine-ammonia ligase
MYQTVGHDAIHFYAECMEVPLYRQDILGSSIIQSSDYRVTEKDETEDLYILLKQVLVGLLIFKHWRGS